VKKAGTYPDIRQITLADLETFFKEVGEPSFRSAQVWIWLWQKGARTFHEMTDIPKSLRDQLSTNFKISPIQIDKTQVSKDGTIKYRFRLYDDSLVESVLIPVKEENRFTVCVSSQVGCSLSCSFCATGQMGRIRNLDAAEIFDQVFIVNLQSMHYFRHPLTNIVFMGMGEPLLTYKNVLESISRITDPKFGLGFSPKRITLSTAGIAKMIYQLGEDRVKFNLALSLHAADDLKRSKIMPINDQNNLESLKRALLHFYRTTKNKITFEYIAFKDFNDSHKDAEKLALYCKQIPVTVNIIQYNPVPGVVFSSSNQDRIDAFARHLRSKKIAVTVRKSRGKDIDAACGQLANRNE
jgi:23S rRNA (adenine2503-C2)-methyltransferase